MTGNVTRQRFLNEFLITIFAVAGFFVILGLVIALNPDISQITNAFFSDLKTVTYNLGSSGRVNLFAPPIPNSTSLSLWPYLSSFWPSAYSKSYS